LFAINHLDIHQGVIDLDEVHGTLGNQRRNCDWSALLPRSLRSLAFFEGKTQVQRLNPPLNGAVVGRGELSLEETTPRFAHQCGHGRPFRVK